MKKQLKLTISALLAASLLGSCAQNEPDNKQQALINDIVNDATALTLPTDAPETVPSDASPKASADTTSAQPAASPAADYDVDIDLTTMNSTMVYATVYDIVNTPEQYLGKTILVNGYFDTGYDESLDTRYYFVVIPDAAACCLQGLEFKASGRNYPDDYPEVRTDICIRGTFGKYDELGHDYYYIETDMLNVI